MVLVSFSVTAVSAPLLGIGCGGFLVDRCGGYRTQKQRTASLGAISLLSFLCVLCGLVAALARSFKVALAAMWFLLFCGGSILPSATGIVLASAPADKRTEASGLAMLLYTFLGYMLGSFLPGLFNQAVGLAKGMQVSPRNEQPKAPLSPAALRTPRALDEDGALAVLRPRPTTVRPLLWLRRLPSWYLYSGFYSSLQQLLFLGIDARQSKTNRPQRATRPLKSRKRPMAAKSECIFFV